MSPLFARVSGGGRLHSRQSAIMDFITILIATCLSFATIELSRISNLNNEAEISATLEGAVYPFIVIPAKAGTQNKIFLTGSRRSPGRRNRKPVRYSLHGASWAVFMLVYLVGGGVSVSYLSHLWAKLSPNGGLVRQPFEFHE